MKRYILFGFDNYYPGGGLNDIVESFDSISEIQPYIDDVIRTVYNNGYRSPGYDQYQIFDLETRTEVFLPDEIVVAPEKKNNIEKSPCLLGAIQGMLGNGYGDNG